jgi:hypothetical protein
MSCTSPSSSFSGIPSVTTSPHKNVYQVSGVVHESGTRTPVLRLYTEKCVCACSLRAEPHRQPSPQPTRGGDGGGAQRTAGFPAGQTPPSIPPQNVVRVNTPWSQ